MEMKMSKHLATILFALFMSTINLSMATDYNVGGANGWSQSTDFQTWTSSITFLQGDNLIFQYTINHDVTEVSKADYDSCTVTNPLQPPFNGGSAVVPLDTPGRRYFICQTSGHCITGMKLEIITLPSATPPPSATPTSSPPPPPVVVPQQSPPSTTPSVPSTPPTATPPMTQPHPPTKSPMVPSVPPKRSISSPVSSPAPKHSPFPYAPKVSPSSTPPTALPPLTASSISPAPLSSNASANVMSGALALIASIMIMIIFN